MTFVFACSPCTSGLSYTMSACLNLLPGKHMKKTELLYEKVLKEICFSTWFRGLILLHSNHINIL